VVPVPGHQRSSVGLKYILHLRSTTRFLFTRQT
jgi:hypothetical protein